MVDERALSGCKGEVFPKEYPYFLLSENEIIHKKGNYRIGKIKTFDTNKEFWIIEDQFSATRYGDENCALKHMEENIKIDEQIRNERK